MGELPRNNESEDEANGSRDKDRLDRLAPDRNVQALLSALDAGEPLHGLREVGNVLTNAREIVCNVSG